MNMMSLERHSSMVEVIKPAVDKLRYRCVVLDNNIRITLVSDPEADKAAAAMDVRLDCGQFAIPRTVFFIKVLACHPVVRPKSFHACITAHLDLVVAPDVVPRLTCNASFGSHVTGPHRQLRRP